MRGKGFHHFTILKSSYNNISYSQLIAHLAVQDYTLYLPKKNSTSMKRQELVFSCWSRAVVSMLQVTLSLKLNCNQTTCRSLRFNLRYRVQCSTFRKKPRDQLAPKFSDLIASSDILVAKLFRPFRPHRSILKVIAGMYDPIGLLSPVLVGMKVLFQELNGTKG